MSEGDTFDRILASLHEAALDDAYWPAASALIDDAVRAKGHDRAGRRPAGADAGGAPG